MANMICRNWLLVATITTFSIIAKAEVAELATSQVDVYLPDIKIYTNILDENQQPLSPSGLEVRVNLDGNQVELAEPPAIFKTTGKGVAYTFLLDVSGSMKGAPYRGAIEAIKNLFKQMTPNDVVAVLTFGDEVKTITAFTRPDQALFDRLQNITPNAQNTHFYKAIQQAFSLNKRRERDLPTRRAVLVITDGKDEGSGITLDDLLDNEIKRQPIPIYSVGFSKLRQDKEKFLDQLKRISNLSGGVYVRSNAHTGFAKIYSKTFGDIQEQMYLHVRASEYIRADGQQHMLQVIVADRTGNQIRDEKKVFFLDAQIIPETSSQTPVSYSDKKIIFQPWHYIAMALAGILLLLIIWWIVRNRRKSKEVDIPALPPSKNDNQILSEPKTSVDNTHEELDQTQDFNEPIGITKGLDTEAVMEVPPKKPQFSRQISFFISDGPNQGMQNTLLVDEKGITIGRRGPEITPNITLTDPKVSRPHCILEVSREWNSVINLSKTGSTFFNGIRINHKHTFNDDECVIHIGDTTISIKLN
jgi:hypothetical protein